MFSGSSFAGSGWVISQRWPFSIASPVTSLVIDAGDLACEMPGFARKERDMKTVVVTGSAGLIGSECVRRFQTHYPDWAYRHDLPAILEAVPWAQAGGG